MRKRFLFILIFNLAAAFILTCNQKIYAASAGPNTPPAPAPIVQPNQPQTQPSNTANNNQTSQQKGLDLSEIYKERYDTLKWSLGLIWAMVIGFGTYLVARREKAYKEAVADAKEAMKEAKEMRDKAETHCEKARDYEQQAQKILASLDSIVKEKIGEMDEQGNQLAEIKQTKLKVILNEIEKEGDRQRKISELFNDAREYTKNNDYKSAAECYKQIIEDYKEESDFIYTNWGLVLSKLAQLKKGNQADELFTESCEKYQKAINLRPDKHTAFVNWGFALSKRARQKEGEQADKLFTEACEKYQKAIELKPDYYKVFKNWSSVLLYWAKRKKGKEREIFLKQAEDKLLKAESIKTGSGSYNFACLYGIRGDKGNCRKWLEAAEKAGTLVTREHAMKDEDLKIVWDEEWFKNLRFKGE